MHSNIDAAVNLPPHSQAFTTHAIRNNKEARAFAVGYTGAVIDLKSDETVGGKKVYQMPALNYEQAFGEVCKFVDEHPELWNRPSREAVKFAVNAMWKKKD